jgi:hypothetical protein
MTRAFVLGNGRSRQGLDLIQLHAHGAVYGCNALYRDFAPDVLVATDRPIADAIQASGYALKNTFYTRRPSAESGAHRIPVQYHGFSSGPVAVALAAIHGHDRIYLLGFDLGADANQQFNNVYADTEFYKKTGDLPTYTGNWCRQIGQITRDFARVDFVRVCGSTTADVPEFGALPNLTHEDFASFRHSINNL